jgi:sulfur-carrier protein
MAVKVILFGHLAEITGNSELDLEQVKDTDVLKQILHLRFPRLATVAYRVAVDKKLIAENVTLPSGSTVALLPPFSGG